MNKTPNGQTFENAGADTSVSEGTNLTASSSTHVKGSYSELIASTSYAAGGMLLVLGGANTGSRWFLVDIAVGVAASEQIILPNLFYFEANSGSFAYGYVPISIPKGSRVAARCQSNGSSNQVRCNITLIAGECVEQSGVAYAVDTGATAGTRIVSSGSSNTKGSWTELTSATSRSHRWGIICITKDGSNSQELVDIGIGGSGSERLLIPNLNFRDSSNGDSVMYSMPMRIPTGTRIAARLAAAGGSQNVSVSLVLI